MGQTPDVWDNSYFDGGYFHNGKIVPAKGFCTDVFFDQANQYIARCAQQNKPFLAYISTNAPHGPLHCPPKYMDMYKEQPARTAAFLGMITNIDDNIGKTRALLQELGVYEDTISFLPPIMALHLGRMYTMRECVGERGSEYDGGHRVPFFLHWPNGGMKDLKKIDTICHAVDIAPTLLDLIGAPSPSMIINLTVFPCVRF